MSRYRNRALKATAALWVFVLLADAGWIATSGAAAMAATVTVVCVGVAVALIARTVLNAREAEPAPARSVPRP